MKSGDRFLVFATLLAFLLAGCPGNDVTTTIPGLDGSSGTTGGSVSTGSSSAPDVSDGQTGQLPICTEPTSGAAWRAEILRLVNEARADRGLGLLTRNETLEAMASQYACEMIQYDFFEHVNPVTGSTLDERADDFGYDYFLIGENLAAGQLTPHEAFAAWMNSEGHRENMLEPQFTELGAGVRTGGGFGVYWVQEFGRPPAPRRRP